MGQVANSSGAGHLQMLHARNARGGVTQVTVSHPWGHSDIVAAASGRGTSTISSAIGAAGLYTICLAVNLCWRQLPDAPSRFLNFTAAALLVGIASTAQFTAVLALGSGTIAFIWLHRSDSRFDRLVHLTHRDRRRLRGAAAFAAAIGVFTFGRRISPLLQGELPSSWTVRWYNISTYFLPPLSHWGNVAWGVSPITQIEPFNDYGARA